MSHTHACTCEVCYEVRNTNKTEKNVCLQNTAQTVPKLHNIAYAKPHLYCDVLSLRSPPREAWHNGLQAAAPNNSKPLGDGATKSHEERNCSRRHATNLVQDCWSHSWLKLGAFIAMLTRPMTSGIRPYQATTTRSVG